MICKEVMRKLEERWNPSYALEWDNVGLLVGREEKEIKKIFTALDATEETIAQALEFGADLLITHGFGRKSIPGSSDQHGGCR